MKKILIILIALNTVFFGEILGKSSELINYECVSYLLKQDNYSQNLTAQNIEGEAFAKADNKFFGELNGFSTIADSTKKPILILGGGYLLSPIEYFPAKRKSNVNFAAPIIITGAGMLLMSSSIKRSQTEWYQKNIKGGPYASDDYLTFVPNALAMGLGIIGVKAKHNFKDRLLIATMANSFMFGAVYGLKYVTKVVRPDKSDEYSFPSAHTAFAFTGAQIMHEEYGSQSIIYSIVGYGVGAATGGLRIANNKHWVSDVVAGAGIGMLSTKLAYRLLPWIKRKSSKKENLTVLPMYLPKGAGVGLAFDIK